MAKWDQIAYYEIADAGRVRRLGQSTLSEELLQCIQKIPAMY